MVSSEDTQEILGMNIEVNHRYSYKFTADIPLDIAFVDQGDLHHSIRQSSRCLHAQEGLLEFRWLRGGHLWYPRLVLRLPRNLSNHNSRKRNLLRVSSLPVYAQGTFGSANMYFYSTEKSNQCQVACLSV